MKNLFEVAMTLDNLIQTIKTSDEGWGLLTGNGFNLACGVKTDYPSLCESLVNSFLNDLTTEELEDFKNALKAENYNFEQWLSKHSKETVTDKIALKAIGAEWLVEFVKACSNDSRQYNFSEKLNEFLCLFQHFSTLNVDPFFYRRCLGRNDKPKKERPLNSEASESNQASASAVQSSAITNSVYMGTELENVSQRDSSFLSKKGKKEMGLIPEETDTPKDIRDGFSKNGQIKKDEKENSPANLLHLHGACHLQIDDMPDGKKTMRKLKSSDDKSLIRSILEEDPRANSAIFAATSEEKLNTINANEYLIGQLDSLKAANIKNLVIYGASIAENDKHIWGAINENTNIEKIYIGFHRGLDDLKAFVDRAFTNKKTLYFKSENFIESHD